MSELSLDLMVGRTSELLLDLSVGRDEVRERVSPARL